MPMANPGPEPIARALQPCPLCQCCTRRSRNVNVNVGSPCRTQRVHAPQSRPAFACCEPSTRPTIHATTHPTSPCSTPVTVMTLGHRTMPATTPHTSPGTNTCSTAATPLRGRSAGAEAVHVDPAGQVLGPVEAQCPASLGSLLSGACHSHYLPQSTRMLLVHSGLSPWSGPDPH